MEGSFFHIQVLLMEMMVCPADSSWRAEPRDQQGSCRTELPKKDDEILREAQWRNMLCGRTGTNLPWKSRRGRIGLKPAVCSTETSGSRVSSSALLLEASSLGQDFPPRSRHCCESEARNLHQRHTEGKAQQRRAIRPRSQRRKRRAA